MGIVRCCTVLLVLMVSASPAVRSQEETALFRRIIITSPIRDAIVGDLVRADDESVLVLANGRLEEIPRTAIDRIILSGESNPSRGIVYGAILGAYGSLAAFGSQDVQPSGYMNGEGIFSVPGAVFALLPMVAICSALGYWIDSGGEGPEEFFDLTGTDESRAAEWGRLLAVLKPAPRVQRIFIVLQGSHVFPAVLMTARSGPSSSGAATNFNILRRIQMTYSVFPELEVGFASVRFGEVTLHGMSSSLLPSGLFLSRNSITRLDATGWYGITAYKYGSPKDGFSVSLGVGAGLASIDYARQGSVYEDGWINDTYVMRYVETSKTKIDENFLSGYVYGSASLELTRGLWLGGVVDHVLVPARTAPADVLLNFPESTLRFGNTSFGFVIGIGF